MEFAAGVGVGALALAAGTRLAAKLRKKEGVLPRVVRLGAPHPEWTPESGVKESSPYEGRDMVTFDPQEYRYKMYPLIVSAIVPRPIALLSSISTEGIVNLAPYSFFNVMCFDPPYVTIGSIQTRHRPDPGTKDSYQNITDTKEFTVSIISHWMVEAANVTCGDFAHNVNEFEAAHLTPMPSQKVKPPRVAESAVHLECVLRHKYPIHNKDGKWHASILVGEVLLVHVNEGVLEKDGRNIDLERLAPICKLGHAFYGTSNTTLDIPMANHAAPQ